MALRAAEQLVPSDGIIVILVPTVGLVAQTLKVWEAHHPHHAALAVCSDRSVASNSHSAAATRADADDTFGDTSDILEPVTTDPEVVAGWLARPGTQGVRLIVGTHMSCHVVGEGLQRVTRQADLTIIDEAHRTAGPVDKHVALVHDDDVLPTTRRLYMTATPRVTRQRRPDTVLHSMDNAAVYGPVLYNYPFSRAIADKWLDDYRVAVIGVTRADVLSVLRRQNGSRPRRSTEPSGTVADQHTAMVQAAIARAANELELRRVIAFCPRIADADHFAQTFPHTLAALSPTVRPTRPLTALAVTGKMKQATRTAILDNLVTPPADGWTVVTNARCLSEGVDVPAVDAIAFTAPKKSEIDIVQAVGRALRRHSDGSGVATIIIPILLPDDHLDSANPQDIEAGAFDILWEVVAALRAHDDTFSNALDTHRSNGFRGNSDVLNRISFAFPEHYGSSAFLDSLTIRLVKSATSNWWDGFAALRKFVDENGHARVHREHVTADGFKLGTWVINARQRCATDTLAPERVEALKKLGFIFAVPTDRWDATLKALTAFHAQHGHLDVPDDLTSTYGANIKDALTQYRTLYRQGKLRPERVQALEALGIDWAPEATRAWRCMMDALRTYRAEHGHVLVPPNLTNAQGRNVSSWLTTQRKRRKRGELSDDEIRELDDVGMVWEDPRWARKIEKLRAYLSQHGTINVTTRQCETDPAAPAIYSMLTDLRRKYKRGDLSENQVAELEALGIDWEPDTVPRRWHAHYREAVLYHRKYGNLDITQDFTTHSGLQLGRWLSEQRDRQMAGTLGAERVTLLEELGITWHTKTSPQTAWDRIIEELRTYRRDIGPLDDVPSEYRTPNGLRLRAWIKRQRKKYSQNGLSTVCVQQLTDLGLTLTPQKTPNIWERDLLVLQRYHAQHGDLRARRDRPPEVIRALANIRKAQRRGRLTDDKIAALDALDTAWRSLPPANWRLRAARRHVEQHGCLPLDRTFVDADGFALGEWVVYQRYKHTQGQLSPTRVAELDALGMIWDLDTAAWDHGLSAARQFHKDNGHLRVTGGYMYRGPDGRQQDLSVFMKRQREYRRAGTLAASRIAALDELGMIWNPVETHWSQMIMFLARYRANHGNIRVPRGVRAYGVVTTRGNIPDQGVDVAEWLTRQRKLYATGDLGDAEISDLDNLGITWNDDGRHGASSGRRDHATQRWESSFARAERFAKENGHLNVPAQQTRESGIDKELKKLYVWLGLQRDARNRGTLSAERIASLDRIGMSWQVPDRKEALWRTNLEKVKKFYTIHGHFDMRHPNDGYADTKELTALYKWLVHQRRQHKDGQLRADRVQMLTAIGFDMRNKMEQAWDKGIAHLADYLATVGDPSDMRPGYQSPDGYLLYNWLSRVKRQADRGELSAEQVHCLAENGITTATVEAQTPRPNREIRVQPRKRHGR